MTTATPEKHLRKIKSFVKRDSRMTDLQRHAVELLLPQLGLPVKEGFIDYRSIFKRHAPVILEIGFGMGHSLVEIAKKHLHLNFIGIETHQPGIGSLLSSVAQHELQNVRIFYADAIEVLNNCILDDSIDGIQIFFPDPWPKRKHHKRRLIQPEFISLMIKKLKAAGSLHLATDWQHYAEHMMKVLSEETSLENIAGEFQYASRSAGRPIVTKFEERGQNSGREIWELQFIRR